MGNRTGLKIMHLGRAIELMHLVCESERGQVWRVRPLFIDDQTPESVTIKASDRWTALHTERVTWRPKAA